MDYMFHDMHVPYALTFEVGFARSADWAVLASRLALLDAGQAPPWSACCSAAGQQDWQGAWPCRCSGRTGWESWPGAGTLAACMRRAVLTPSCLWSATVLAGTMQGRSSQMRRLSSLWCARCRRQAPDHPAELRGHCAAGAPACAGGPPQCRSRPHPTPLLCRMPATAFMPAPSSTASGRQSGGGGVQGAGGREEGVETREQRCLRSYNPLAQEDYQDVVARWLGALLVLAAHLAAHPAASDAAHDAGQSQLPLPPVKPSKQDLVRCPAPQQALQQTAGWPAVSRPCR